MSKYGFNALALYVTQAGPMELPEWETHSASRQARQALRSTQAGEGRNESDRGELHVDCGEGGIEKAIQNDSMFLLDCEMTVLSRKYRDNDGGDEER